MIAVRVAGGTGAGSKRPLRQARSWECACPPRFGVSVAGEPRTQPSWRTRCVDCGACKP